MVDIRQENLVALRDVPALLPARANGKKIHVSAIYRWVSRGVGGVRLDVIRIGGTAYTSVEALQRFGRHQVSRDVPLMNSISRRRQKVLDRVEQQLRDKLGPENP